jgi:ABC-type uncharacterized transport system ATPase subunit
VAPLLSMRGISKRFGSLQANDRIDFAVEAGEIHGLLGENGAGKTTLMNVLFGLCRADAGEIRLDGRTLEVASPAAALAAGIGMVHQHFALVPDMTGAENVALAEAGRPRRARLDEVATRLERLAARHGLHVDFRRPVEELSVGERQRLEILKVLFRGARILVLDEPTSVLTPPEWEALAGILRSLAADGHAIVLISHKLDEVTEACGRCTVLRDGRVVASRDIAAVDKAELARLMVGRDVEPVRRRARRGEGRAVLRLEDVSVADEHGPPLAGVSLTVRAGEIVGIAGVDGNGQHLLVEAVCGLRAVDTGTVSVAGEAPADAGHFGRLGGALVPRDRHREGVADELSVADNLIMRDFARPPLARSGFLRPGRIDAHCRRLVQDYDVRVQSLHAPLGRLSGGNQQKAVLARELSRNPKLLVAAQPTRGLDVGAYQAMHEQLLRFAEAGGATLLISAELDEVLALSDRIGVLYGGRLVGMLDAQDATVERIGLWMAGQQVPA